MTNVRGDVSERWWVALVTFERSGDQQDVLPATAQGACGYMLAIAPDERTACEILISDLRKTGLRVLEIAESREVFGDDEIEELDGHLASNFRTIGRGKSTVWGVIHCYRGEGEA